MIFTRETTPLTIRRGTVVVELRTPSMRNRTLISRGPASRCTSEAPWSAAWAMIVCTSLMTGASWADSRRSTTSAPPCSSSSSSTASWTASSSRRIRAITDAMSSGEATAGRTSRPVISAMSSTASTLDGSASATTIVRSSTNATGTAE